MGVPTEQLQQVVWTSPRSTASRARAYLALTKPRIIELLLVTTVPVMFLAQRGFPPLWTLIATLIGGALAAGGANALNCYLDRDIDALMERTGHRPSVTGEVTPRANVTFGIALSVLSVVWLTFFVNLWSAGFAAAAIFLYVVGYTIVLKRRTSSNIVWGGVAGCFPVLIGWVAVTGSLSWAPLVLFLVVFFWTPPHYWPLSLRYREDYAAAGVPMLPVVATDAQVARRIVAYSWVMVATSFVLIPVAPMGPVYAIAAVVLGAWFLVDAHMLSRRLHRGATDVRAMRLFHGSIGYLSLLFLAVAVDPFVGAPLF
jgi:heme o synthase